MASISRWLDEELFQNARDYVGASVKLRNIDILWYMEKEL